MILIGLSMIVVVRFGWGGRIRTYTIRINSAVSYRLDHAPVVGHFTIQRKRLLNIGGSG